MSDGVHLTAKQVHEMAVMRRVCYNNPDVISQVVCSITGIIPLTTPVFISRGLGNENWLVETDRGFVLVKVAPKEASLEKMRVASIGVGRALEVGVPTPRLIAFEDECHHLDGKTVRIFQYIDGNGLGNVQWLGETPSQFWSDLGTAIRRLHEVKYPYFCSRLDGSAPSFTRWDEYLSHRLPQIAGRLRLSTFVDARAFEPMLSAATSLASRLSHDIKAALTHRDLHPDNIVESHGRLAAILDFDQSEAWDPVSDFHKLYWFIFDEEPKVVSAFCDGYGDPSDIHRHFSERLHIAGTFELVNTLAGLESDEKYCLKDIVSRLRAIATLESWPDPGDWN